MRQILLSVVLVCVAGCATRPTSPMAVGDSYQVRLTDSANVAQVDVVDTAGDWVRLRYHKNSPRVDSSLDDVWVNSSHIIWVVPYR